MRVQTQIQGIPCEVEAVYHKALPGAVERSSGLPLDPGEPAGWEIVAVYDRKGYKANWLHDKITWGDELKIVSDLGLYYE